MTESPTAFMYLHTHWDREWYLPFEIYRARLVALVRSIVESLKNGSLPNFLLDGQASVLEDVMEIEPSLQGPISQLMQEGQLSAGPWYVLADQMLVSGESLIRNLQFGLEITGKFGPPAMIGYCPDTFGHSADLPRILTGFGIDNAYVWRGVPKLEGGPVFFWKSPDGSSVIAYQLSRGYYRTEFHSLSAVDELESRLQTWLKVGDAHFCQALNGSLIPVGGDHLGPPRDLYRLAQARVPGSANAGVPGSSDAGGTPALPGPNISFVTLPQFTLRLQSLLSNPDLLLDLPSVDGELRDNSAALAFERAYLLPGVLSTRLYLKRANRIAEHRLNSVLEPLFVQLAIDKKFAYPDFELHHAWKLLLQNHPHDSICGCSIDVVHQEIQMRTIKFHQLLDALEAEATRSIIAASQCSSYPLISIPTGAHRHCSCAQGDCCLVDPSVPINSVQVFNLSANTLAAPIPVSWTCEKETTRHALSDDHGQTNLQIDAVEKSTQIFCGTGGEPVVKDVFVHKGWLWTEALPAFGYKILPWMVKCGEAPRNPTAPAKTHGHAVAAHPRQIANEFLSLTVEGDGALVVTCNESRGAQRVFALVHKIRDVADCGDLYNFDPLPGDQPLLAKFIDTSEGLGGPLVSSLKLHYEMPIPQGLDELVPPPMEDGFPLAPGKFQRTKETILHSFMVEVSLRRGAPIVFFDLKWTNKSCDHRLEVVFETGSRIDATYSENHFSILKRKAPSTEHTSPIALPVPKGQEAPADRFPCQRFFVANRQIFLNCGLPEYAVDGSTACLTVLRSVSNLNRARLATRGGGAGPSVPTPEGNCLGNQQATYGWAPLKNLAATQSTALDAEFSVSELPDSEPADAEPADAELSQLPDEHCIQSYTLAEIFEGKSWSSFLQTDEAPVSKSFVAIDNAACKLLGTYFKEQNDSIFLRILNVSNSEQTAVIRLNFPFHAAYLCKLNEQTLAQSRLQQEKDQISLQVNANELLTLKVELIR